MSTEPKKASEIDDATALALKAKIEGVSTVKKYRGAISFKNENVNDTNELTSLSSVALNSDDGDFLEGVTITPDDDAHYYIWINADIANKHVICKSEQLHIAGVNIFTVFDKYTSYLCLKFIKNADDLGNENLFGDVAPGDPLTIYVEIDVY